MSGGIFERFGRWFKTVADENEIQPSSVQAEAASVAEAARDRVTSVKKSAPLTVLKLTNGHIADWLVEPGIAKIQYITDYPLPDTQTRVLHDWIAQHGMPYQRSMVIRLLACYEQRLPSQQELSEANQKKQHTLNLGFAWVRDSRQHMYSFADARLVLPSAQSHRAIALLSINDR